MLKMQVSIDIKPELYQYLESTASSLGKSISEIIADKFQPELDEEQQAKNELVKFLEPTIKELRNGIVSEKSFDEIVNEALEEVTHKNKK